MPAAGNAVARLPGTALCCCGYHTRVVFGMSKADGSITVGRQGKAVTHGRAVGFLLAVPQLLQIALSWGDPVFCQVRGCGRTFAGLALSVASCLEKADMPSSVLLWILDNQKEIFFFYHRVHLQGDLVSWQSDSPLFLRQDISDFMV